MGGFKFNIISIGPFLFNYIQLMLKDFHRPNWLFEIIKNKTDMLVLKSK